MLSFGPSKERKDEIPMADVDFIRDNYPSMTVAEIIAARGITEQQISRTVEQLRKRGVKVPFKREESRPRKTS